jgi:hypothetical protein
MSHEAPPLWCAPCGPFPCWERRPNIYFCNCIIAKIFLKSFYTPNLLINLPPHTAQTQTQKPTLLPIQSQRTAQEQTRSTLREALTTKPFLNTDTCYELQYSTQYRCDYFSSIVSEPWQWRWKKTAVRVSTVDWRLNRIL